ncbi:MAG: DNA-directed RNA polymerase subunit alpha [Chloroflexi bacterium]|nr:DNA-directed RNA polymerase subunit alpha [Chloroflexota bacterium]
MLELVLPKVEAQALVRNYGKFVIGPLEAGYGITLGSALRRSLLSSLPGAAVTSMKVDGIHHDFSPIPHLKEDTLALMLNVKQIRFRMEGQGPLRLRLTKKGEGVVSAGDIESPSEVEIVNPDLKLATLDSDKARLELELVVERGRGYSPAEGRGKLPIGELPVDAVFSPIRKVSYNVDRVRVGQVTNFDQLIMEIWTDGTIEPREALSTAAQILVRHLNLVVNFGGLAVEEFVESTVGIPPRIYETPVEELDLSVRAFNCLKRAGITKVGEVLERLEKGDEEILSIRNFGQKSLDELKEALAQKGFLSWRESALGGRPMEEIAEEV